MSFRISQAGGIIGKADTTLKSAPEAFALFEADAAITPGKVVGLDTGNTLGKLVVTCPIGAPNRALGIYTGQGGTGAATSTAGLTGRAAVDGDIIWVQTAGVCNGLVDGDTTNAVEGDVLIPSKAVAGELQSTGTVMAADEYPFAILLDAGTTGAGPVVNAVFLKGMF